jgi:multimeric flavodoxin WrbA
VSAVKKVTMFMGSPQKRGATYTAARRFLDDLESFGDVQGEIVVLSDYDIGMCRGCKVCFNSGEERCPLKDDRDVLIEKMMASDGVVFASPNYSFQVSGMMKVFLDRLGFLFHRPRFHGKTFTSVVVEGIHGGRKLVTYLDFVGWGLGFSVVKGTVSNSREPVPEKVVRKRDKALAKQTRRFHQQLSRPADRAPRLRDLFIFRWSRTLIGIELDDSSRDYRYYSEKGWFESDYWYPTRLGVLKRSAGTVFDFVFARLSKARAD